MHKYVLIVLSVFLLGAAPSRTKPYIAGQIIDPEKVTENEDNIFSYLQAGVEVYKSASVTSDALASGAITTAKLADGAVSNTQISASAAIAFSKLATLTSGNLLVGNSANAVTSVTMSGDATINNTGTLTIANNAVALSTDTTGNYLATLADAGNSTITVANSGSEGAAVTVDAVDVNCSNCIDGTDIALGSDAQGDIMYYSGTDWVRLGAGTSGQFLKTQGAGANPTWAGAGNWVFVETLTLTGTSVTSSTLPTDGDVFLLVFDTARSGTSGDFGLQFNGDTATNYAYIRQDNAALAAVTGDDRIQLVQDQTDITGSVQFDRPAPLTRHGVVCNISTTLNTDAYAISGNWTSTAAITSVTILDAGGATNMSGKVHIYKLNET